MAFIVVCLSVLFFQIFVSVKRRNSFSCVYLESKEKETGIKMASESRIGTVYAPVQIPEDEHCAIVRGYGTFTDETIAGWVHEHMDKTVCAVVIDAGDPNRPGLLELLRDFDCKVGKGQEDHLLYVFKKRNGPAPNVNK